MNAALVEQVANAVLYEGYILYPYRPTALKNRKRANFGVVPPRGQMRTECLFTGDDCAGIGVKVRFLHLADKDDWQEAVECVVSVPGCNVASVVSQPVWEEFAFPLDITGMVEVSASRVAESVFRVSVAIFNTSPG